MMRLQLKFQSVLLLTAEAAEKQTVLLQDVTQSLQHTHQHVNQRIDSLEQMLEKAFSQLRGQLGPESGQKHPRSSRR